MSLTEFTLDIEAFPHRYPDYLLSFPDKIKTHKDGTQYTKKEPGLHAIISEVCCVGLEDVESEEAYVISRSSLPDEANILKSLYKALKAIEKPFMVSFRGEAYDLPVLRLRGALYGIPLAKVLPYPKSHLHADIYERLGGKWQNDSSSCSLSELAWCLLGSAKETDGGSVAEWASKGDWLSIDEHCLEDVHKTTLIYKMLKGCYL